MGGHGSITRPDGRAAGDGDRGPHARLLYGPDLGSLRLPGNQAAIALTLAAVDGKRRNGRWVRGTLPAGNRQLADSEGWETAMYRAGLVLDYAPDLAAEVVAGELTLSGVQVRAASAPASSSIVAGWPISAAVRCSRHRCRDRRAVSSFLHRSEHQRRGRPRPDRCGTAEPHRAQIMPPFSAIGKLSETVARIRPLCAPLAGQRAVKGAPPPPARRAQQPTRRRARTRTALAAETSTRSDQTDAARRAADRWQALALRVLAAQLRTERRVPGGSAGRAATRSTAHP